jgi:hypothetical protein
VRVRHQALANQTEDETKVYFLCAHRATRRRLVDNVEPCFRALANVWEGQRFSCLMTKLLHGSENGSRLERRLQVAELDNLFRTKHAEKNFAESYVGPENAWSFK